MARGTSARAAEVRATIAMAGGAAKGRGAGYGAAARKVAVSFARERLSAGSSLHAVARDVGVRAATLRTWVTDATRDSGFAEVTLHPAAAPAATYALVHASGWRVDGLDLEAVRALVQVVP